MLMKFIKLVFRDMPQEVAAAIWRLIIFLIMLVLLAVRAICNCLRGAGECEKCIPRKPRCNKVPENIKRKPDPCIYSQFYLMSRGLSVTWDNPDIWITRPGASAQENSGSLQPDTDYIIHVRIHDASFDPALATLVRCYYRPWSFNSPEVTPVETNPDGSEKTYTLHIQPWSNEIALFKWRTPTAAGHYCLQAECRHPDDMNSDNNLGQENTNVINGNPGETITTNAFLFNNTGEEQKFRIFADRYMIPEDKFIATLKTLKIPFRKKRVFDVLHRAMLTYDIRKKKMMSAASHDPLLIRYAYTGWDALKEKNRRGDFPIGPEWDVRISGQELRKGWSEITVKGGAGLNVPLSLRIPANSPRGARHRMNFSVVEKRGVLLGGVTLEIRINN